MSARPHIVTAALIRTMDDAVPSARAMAVLGDRIVAVGAPGELRERFPGAEVRDHGDAVLVPGFNDAHQHLVDMAVTVDQVDAGELADSRAMLAALAQRSARTPPGRWVRAFRYDETRGDGPQITRADLDRVSVEHPILVTQVSDHWGVLNTPALELAGLDRHGDGVVTELELFRLAWSDDAVVDLPSTDEHIDGIAELTRRYHAAGITSVGDALVTAGQLALYREARRRGRLSVRVTALIDAVHVEEYLAAGVGSGFGDEWLRVGGFKAFVDGAVAGRSCLLEQPFEGSGEHGVRVTPTEELRELFRRVHLAGSALAVHANGDRAIGELLDVVEGVLRESGDTGPVQPHRIEHCSVLTPELVRRIRAAGLAVVPFGGYVGAHGSKLLAWYGAERLRRMFAHRWLLDHGVPVGGSSDYSTSPYEPLAALRGMTTRESSDGTVLGAEQRVSAAEALWVYTVGSATVAGEGHYKGRLAPGYLADYVVLGADPLAVPVGDLADIPVLRTVVGGTEVWGG
ncbi:amidohydrolase [Pseudonocardia acaciae]|uniref:amidohydrolase n=1 Tax=Pseudonocardia acaciae TaxID=551276 RepID=UPI00056A1943|nr:amidohydrolase [Pseudonocardia acaciae]